MVIAMAGQESYVVLLMLEDVDGGGRIAPGRNGVDSSYWLVAFELLQSGAANHGNMDGSYIAL